MLTNRLFCLLGRQVQRSMSHTRFARLLLVCFIALFAVITPQTVFASQPEIFTFHDEFSDEIDCGSFIATEDIVVDSRVTLFFDQAGNPIKVQVHVDFNGVLTNLSTGFTLLDPAHATILVDLQEGTETQVGLIYRIIVPGEDIAVLDAGKLIFDADGNFTFVGGPHQQLFGGNDLICAALD